LLRGVGGGEVIVSYGELTLHGKVHRIIMVERIIGPSVTDERGHETRRTQIIQIHRVPPPRENEYIIFPDEPGGCKSPAYVETAARIYAQASVVPTEDQLMNTNEPSAAWRLDRETARLIPISPRSVVCTVYNPE
jgi:hypothetical protein